jgi:hypothetical protein
MKKLHLSSLAICATFAMALAATPANAQASRTWVSGVGDDANPCSRTAPCKTFAGAISKTATNGEINCLDPGGFGGLTITKSITVDCHEIYGSILVAGVNGITIPFDNFAGTDARRTVRLRNLNFNGVDTGTNGIRITGGAGSANSEVVIQDCMIDGFQGSPGRGISDERTGGGKILITNTTVRNNAGTGITINPAAGTANGATIHAIIDNVYSFNNLAGFASGSSVKMMLNRSVASGNSGAGFFAEGTFSLGELSVDNSVSSNNGTGVQNGGGAGGVNIRLSNTDIAFNGTGITGSTSSFGNNRIAGNTAAGAAPTLIPPNNSNPSGQQ